MCKPQNDLKYLSGLKVTMDGKLLFEAHSGELGNRQLRRITAQLVKRKGGQK